MKHPAIIRCLVLSLLFPMTAAVAQAQEYPPVIPFVTQGTDFWVAFPWLSVEGYDNTHFCLYVVSERDCEVTVSNEAMDYHQTYQIERRYMAGPETNYFEIPRNVAYSSDEYVPGLPPEQQPANQPSYRCFHITSTDTIALYAQLFHHYYNHFSPTNILPTEMLRDEYVLQMVPHTPYNCHQKYAIVATEDSTVVDIVLSDTTWMGHRAGDTITVTLNRGQFYYLRTPIFSYEDASGWFPPKLRYPHHILGATIQPLLAQHIDKFDLSGTLVKARDCKRVAVFAGTGTNVWVPDYVSQKRIDITNWPKAIYKQLAPTRFGGFEHVVFPIYPAALYLDSAFVRITALYDNTVVSYEGRNVVTLNARETYWCVFPTYLRPSIIHTSRPAMCYYYGWGDGTFNHVRPTEYWLNSWGNFCTFCWHDESNNRYFRRFETHIIIQSDQTANVRLDAYPLDDTSFHPIPGTSYSYANFDFWPQVESDHGQGTHQWRSLGGAPYMAMISHDFLPIYVAQYQPGNSYFYFGDVLVDSMPQGYGQCRYDSVAMRVYAEHPADSIVWDFGDGTPQVAGPYAENTSCTHLYDTAGHFTIRAIVIFPYEGCFTRPYDTLSWDIEIYGPVDSNIYVNQCIGAYTFRDQTYETNGVYSYYAPRHGLECDTMFHIHFTTCPHCSYHSDTISPDQLPYTYNNVVFTQETHNTFIHLDIGDECDSIINYSLIVIPNWGEKPIDSVFIQAPNVFTPGLSSNNIFQLYCSPHILQAQVSVYDRRGSFITRFDGLSGHWDGTAHGQPCPQGTYVYYVRYIDTHDHSWKTFCGTVTLIR